ncbi:MULTISPECIES: zinc-dependent metalloprotease [Kocuria]|uniref:zinc-dependent metalloprotease n=1 Tax=Kocuria TaxID=57493 RepID=UPI00159454C0|nr:MULTISPECIES: zinc-dependent metalloprotease [Kocuria]NVC24294.1 hydrolase [Kocuria salina]WIG16685.1 zinc-dependent metalloprotease [Kocuria rosea]
MSAAQRPPETDAPGIVRWDLAASAAARLTPPGPRMSARAMQAAVASMRRHAEASVDHVHRITGLEAARDLRDSTVLVVDRAGWSKANAQAFEVLMEPAVEALRRRRPEQFGAAATALGGTATAMEMAAVLGFLSAKVLGQYDPYAGLVSAVAAQRHPGGRLMLVAPNILTVERELNVEPEDFRLWVCLHEQTHRVQFAAAPWLREHMIEQINELADSLMGHAETLGARLTEAVRALPGRGAGAEEPRASLGVVGLLMGRREREVLSHLTAVMSLLEGHANFVMDGVDASVVPSVKTIRRRFERRSELQGSLDRFVRRLLGMDAKMRQYSDGQRFVTTVVGTVGLESFNRIWEAPEHLPTEAEIHAPERWIERVLGPGAPPRRPLPAPEPPGMW